MGAVEAYQRADVLLEHHGDRTAAEASYRRVDQRGDANSTFNLAILEEQGDHIGALRAYQRAEHMAVGGTVGWAGTPGGRIGAQVISTDYLSPDARFGPYRVPMPGGVVARLRPGAQ